MFQPVTLNPPLPTGWKLPGIELETIGDGDCNGRGLAGCAIMMLMSQNREVENEVLVAHQSWPVAPDWLGEMDQAFRPVGMTICRAHTAPATIARVELGGLAAAVLIADLWEIDGLSLLRIIRSIDDDLPCWLITDAPTRSTLEAALALRATCVMNHPPSAGELALVIRRRLMN